MEIDGGEFGFTYTGPIEMGTAKVGFDVVYDTGSDWLAIEGDECSTCDGDKFDGSGGEITDEKQTERNYGSASLKGHTYKD